MPDGGGGDGVLLYLSLPHKVWRKPWNVDAREVGSGAKAVEYVARYVQKTALDPSRITAVDETGVSFRWTERESGKERITKLSGEESKPPGAGLR